MSFNAHSNLPPVLDGYRELQLGEEFKEGDILFDYNYQRWEKRLNYFAKVPYNPFHKKLGGKHHITIRKIEKTKIKTRKEIYDIIYNIYIEAVSQADYIDILKFLEHYCIERIWEIGKNDFEDDYKYIHTIQGNVCCGRYKFINKKYYLFKELLLELNLISNIEISEEKKKSIIYNLNNLKAFNEDSALKVSDDDYLSYKELSKLSIIKIYKEKFFI